MTSTAIIVSWWIAVAILIVILWKGYWRLQMHFNATSLALYTPDTFPLLEEGREEYEKMVHLGKKHASESTVVICGMLRDTAKNIPNIQRRVEKLGSLFKDYRVLIVENDSTDGTREKLLKWRERNPRVNILGCGINAKECHLSFPKTEGHGVDRKRIDKMINLRNMYLDEVRRSYPSIDYTIVWDLDIIGSVYLDGVQNSMGYLGYDLVNSQGTASSRGTANSQPKISAMTANGMYRWGILTLYYDTYALLQHEEGFDINYKTASDVRKGLGFRYVRGQYPVNVKSAFGGFSIYRTRSLLADSVDYTQSASDGDNILCEHTNLCKKLRGIVYVNPSMIHYILLNA